MISRRKSSRTPCKWDLTDSCIIGPTGKERCLDSAAGRRDYAARTAAMAERQGGICAICGLWMVQPTFDHQEGRTVGKRDDRIEIEGQWHNTALDLRCNQNKGSKRPK